MAVEKLSWTTGRWTSTPEDGRCFLERDNDDWWWVYKTGDNGRLMEGFPKITEHPFHKVEDAQEWVERNVPPRSVKCTRCGDSGLVPTKDWDVFHRCACQAGASFQPPVGDA